MDRGLLRQLLRTSFNEAELRDICFELAIDFEELAGQTKLDKIRELISYCERGGRLPDLLTLCQQMRPHVSWQDAAQLPAASTEREKLEQAIRALEAQRATLGDAIVNAALTPLQQQLEALKSPKLPPQRKQITVLYARQAGFTMMYQTTDLEALRDLMHKAWERLDTAVTQQGGWVNGRTGDQMTALFGAATAHPDDPARAVKAALAMQASLAEMKKEHNIPLSIRIGISTGSVLLEQVGAHGEFSIIGDTVKIASSLENQAPFDSILITDSTYDQVRGVFDIAPADPVTLKEGAEPLPCYLVRGLKAVAFNVERHSIAGITTPMIGRDLEMSQLTEAYFASTEDNERQWLTVTGDSGLGKTRLLDEFFDWLELRPERIRIFRGEALPETQGTPYGLLRDMLARRLPDLQNDADNPLPKALETHLTEALLNDPSAQMKAHFIGHLLGFGFADSPHVQPVAADAKQLQDRATLYLVEYFGGMTQLRPVVIFLDNLQWADDSSLDLLNRLALALSGKRMLTIAAVQPDFWQRRPHWGEGYDWHTRLLLQPLSRRQSRQLLGEILKKMDHPPDFLQEKILNNAVGNPLYLVEIVKMLLRDGIIVEEGEGWVLRAEEVDQLRVPSALVGLLQAGVDALPVPERSALRQAAVVGTTFWNRTVAFLAGDATGEQIETTDRVLAQLHQHQIISRREASRFVTADEYAFRNVMLRQVAQESIPGRARQVYHGLVAKWLLEQSGGQAGENAGEIAEHLERSGQKEKAVAWLQQAGDQAAARFAHAEAAAYFGRALALTPDEDIQTRITLLLKRETSHHLRGKRALQEADITALESLAAQLGDTVLQIRVALLQARLANAKDNYPAAIAAAEHSLALAQRISDAYFAGSAYLAWSRALIGLGRYDEARHYLDEALAHARTAVQPKLEADSLQSLGRLAWLQGDFLAASDFFQKTLSLYRHLGDQQGESTSLNSLGAVAQRLWNFKDAHAYFEQSHVINQNRGNRLAESISLGNLGVIANYEGDYAGARTYIEQCLAISRQVGQRSGEAWSLNTLGDVARFEGKYAEARNSCEQALTIWREIGEIDGQSHCLAFLGHALAELGELKAAATAYEEAVTLRRQLAQYPEAMEPLAGLLRVSLAQANLKKAAEQAEEIADWLETEGVGSMEYPLEVQLTCYKGLMAVAAKDAGYAARAANILAQAHASLMAQAENLSDTAARQRYFENIAVNREVLATWEAHQNSEKRS